MEDGYDLAGRNNEWKAHTTDDNSEVWLLPQDAGNTVMRDAGCSLVVVTSSLDRERSVELISALEATLREVVPDVDLTASAEAAGITVTNVEVEGGSTLIDALAFAGPLLVVAAIALVLLVLVGRNRRG